MVQHGLVGIIPVHALPLEEVSSAKEPGRPRSAAVGRPVSAGGAAARGGGGGAGVAAPLVVLDRYVLVESTPPVVVCRCMRWSRGRTGNVVAR